MSAVLVSWIGMTDLKAASGKLEGGWGPVCGAAKERQFDRFVLLSNYDAAATNDFGDWLRGHTEATIEVRPVSLTSPMDFREVYEAADSCVQRIVEQGDVRLTFHLSPGTSAMTAMWLILATTKYDAELIASSLESGVYTPEFPFDIAADYLPRKTARAKSKAVTAVYEGRTPAAFDKIIHKCDAMKRAISRAQRVAQFDVPVMILGESGTGKELFAEAIHNASPRAAGPYVAVNCGALPADLVESELFGHIKGSFTGATSDRAGFFEQADRGTLFLDELGELPYPAQVKLLRAVQEAQIQRVGDDRTRQVDVRIISATNRDLPSEIHDGRFREDLFHRLAIGVLNLPALRDRREDLTALIDFRFAELEKTIRRNDGSTIPHLSAGAKAVIQRHHWPGNIRALFNALTRAVIWCESAKITREEMSESLLSLRQNIELTADNVPLGGSFDLDAFLKDMKSQLVQRALEQTRTQKQAAELLGVSDSNLRQKLKSIKPT